MTNLSRLALAALALLAAPLAAQSLKERVVADAAAVPVPAFERTVTVTQADAKEKASQVRIDRWDGRGWTLVSVGGKPPTASDQAQYAKASAAAIVPSYRRLAVVLARAVPAGSDAQGRALLRAADLPPGAVITNGKDVSERFTGEASVAAGPKPWVQQLRLTAKAPFRMMLVAKIERFTTVSDYRLDAAGQPRLARQVADITGSMLGQSGTQHVETVLTYR